MNQLTYYDPDFDDHSPIFTLDWMNFVAGFHDDNNNWIELGLVMYITL
jgi:hypothetical protein